MSKGLEAWDNEVSGRRHRYIAELRRAGRDETEYPDPSDRHAIKNVTQAVAHARQLKGSRPGSRRFVDG